MKIDVADLQSKFGVTTETLADAIGRPIEIVQDWQSAAKDAPPYIALTIEAISRRLRPESDQVMLGADLYRHLGITKGTEKFWKATHGFPLAARWAVAAALRPTPDLNHYDIDVLRRLNEATHYRAHNGWRARPVLGKPYPTVRKDTPQKLIAAGLVMIKHNPDRLALTPAGLQKVYGHAR